MSGVTERVMNDLMIRLSSTSSFNTIIRSEFEVFNVEDMPVMRVSQGSEELTLETLTSSGGTYVCDLSVSIEIIAAKGTQNIETTLNNLCRNALQALYSTPFSFFRVFEESVSKPELEDLSGDIVGRLILNINCNYDRPYNDAT